MKKLALFLILIMASLTNVIANEASDLLEENEIKNYDPQKQGLKDLVFEARIDNLAEILKAVGNFGNVTDLHFKVYWLPTNQYKIDVNGLPPGFEEVRNDLATLIKTKLDFVIPSTVQSRLKDYDLKTEATTEGKTIVATDPQGRLPITLMKINFDKSGKLSTMNYATGGQTIETKFASSPKSWSNNKNLLDTLTITTKQGIQTNIITNKVEYLTESGIGFPSKLIIKNLTTAKIPAQGDKKEQNLKQETGTTVRFSNYEVNTGKAQRYMMGGQKR